MLYYFISNQILDSPIFLKIVLQERGIFVKKEEKVFMMNMILRPPVNSIIYLK